MSRTGVSAGIGVIALFLGLLAACPSRGIRFGGGPAGATAVHVAAGMVEAMRAELRGVPMVVESSGGSEANLIGVEKRSFDMALVHTSDYLLGNRGQLAGDGPPTHNVLALARLYGSTVQLLVRQESEILSPADLRGHRVAIGSHGSGAAQSAERYFKALGVWQDIIPIYSGYDAAIEELVDRRVDAVWAMAGYPTVSLAQAFYRLPVRLVELQQAGRASGFFQQYPFYTEETIPANTYILQKEPVSTFTTTSLWVAGAQVDEELVYRALTAVFSPDGLTKVRSSHDAVSGLTESWAVPDVTYPLHPGAVRFWRERGRLVPEPPESG